MNNCIFCLCQETERVIEENALAYVARDAFPVTKYHTLIIPKRHVLGYFELNKEEVLAIDELLKSQKLVIDEADSTVGGYNIGWNYGEIGGQSVWHAHAHLIPRRSRDVKYPKGGVRHVIPFNQSGKERQHKFKKMKQGLC